MKCQVLVLVLCAFFGSSTSIESGKTVRQYPSYVSQQSFYPPPNYNYPSPPIAPYPYSTYQQPIINQPAFPLVYPTLNNFYPYYPTAPYSNYPSQYFPTNSPYPFPPYQQPYPTNAEPLAHIPTEIIDIDLEKGDAEPQLKFQWPVLYRSDSSAAQNPIQPFKFVQMSTATARPIKIVATRIFENGSSEPKVAISYDTNSKPGSGTLVEATTDQNETAVTNKDDSKNTKKEKEKSEDSPTGFSLFGY